MSKREEKKRSIEAILDECLKMRRRSDFWRQEFKRLEAEVSEHLNSIEHMSMQSADRVKRGIESHNDRVNQFEKEKVW